MLKTLFLTLTTALIFSAYSIAQDDDYLIAFNDANHEHVGFKNAAGDTIIPFGKYLYSYTDTLKSMAIVLHQELGWIGIDKDENILFHCFIYDNGPDYVEEGLFRIVKDDKIGFANEDGVIVIEPIYQCAFPFEGGKAQVALNCKSVPIGGEYSKWVSEEWLYIDKNGQIIKSNE